MDHKQDIVEVLSDLMIYFRIKCGHCDLTNKVEESSKEIVEILVNKANKKELKHGYSM